jgi:hypothetical protein
MEEGKEIVKKEEHPVLITVANALFKSGLFPNVKNSYGAFAITQYGSELGIGPMTALQTMAIVSGKICMGAQMMLSLAIKSGVSFKIVKDDNNECQIHFKRGELEYTSSFSIAEAKQAGIYRDQSGWTKYPRDMLYWRTVTRGLRRVCPDVITGLYAIEELQDAIPLNAKVEEVVVDDVSSEGNDLTPPPASSTYEEYYKRMSEISNPHELKNWWSKHYKEMEKNLLQEQFAEIVTYKDFLKNKFAEEKK